jgi:hypothetical protein
MHRMLGQHGCCLGCKVLITLKPQQGEGVSGSAVQRAQAAVVVILPPQPIVTTTRAESQPRLARRLQPPRLSRPLVHCERYQQRSGRSPADVVRRVGNVAPNERVQIVRECCVRGEPAGDQQRPRLPVQERSRAVMLILQRVRLGTLELECAQRGGAEIE